MLLRMENTDLENNYYIQAIQQFGGEVLLFDEKGTEEELLEKLEQVEGILLPGGNEVGKWDFYFIDYALSHSLKLLGICQGMQSMALFGSHDSLISIGNSNHQQKEGYVHSVSLKEGRLSEIFGVTQVSVNSHHMQTVSDSILFSITGYSEDGLIEVVENPSHVFQIGVQWHPERMLSYDKLSCRLLENFIEN